MIRYPRALRRATSLIAIFTAVSIAAAAAELHGVISDPTGAVIPNAKVELIVNTSPIAAVRTNAKGQYVVQLPPASGSRLRVSAQGFNPQELPLSSAIDATMNVSMRLATFAEEVTVTSTGTPTPQAQLGVSITELTAQSFAGARDAQDALRLVPGLQLTQVGQAGGTTSLFIRGGAANANKVLLDGIPANDIGGDVDFATTASVGIGGAEILRGPNSALYGSDALAGVVSLTTARGSTLFPLLTYRTGGGNFNTYQQEGTLSGAFKRSDYFSDYARFDSANSVPDSVYHNGTFTGNYGLALSPRSSVRATVRHDQVASGLPNAILLYGIPSNAKQTNEDAYFGVTLDDQTTDQWHNLVRYGGVRLRSQYHELTLTGIPQYEDYSGSFPVTCSPASDPNCFLADYLGAPVTIRGANGYTVSGQAVYQYSGDNAIPYPSSTDKDFVYAQTDYRLNPHALGLFAFRYEDERGYSSSVKNSIQRGNYSYTMQIQDDIRNHLFYTLGSGIEENGLFGFAGTPRGSVAWRVANGGGMHFLSGTKLRASFGEGIKEPSISDQTSSLYQLLDTLSNGAQLISQYHVTPIGPQQSRSYDGGVDQSLFNGRGIFSVNLFHNEFKNGVEYISKQALMDLGVPAAIAALATYGATANSKAYRAQGVEIETGYQAGHGVSVRGGYTYVDATIQRSFSSDAMGPSFNPNFPTIAIGMYSPLIGARPFRVAPHTGYFETGYRHRRFDTDLRGTFVGRRDDSDFLGSDTNGGLTMLLPNRNLDAAYQRIDLSATYQANRHISVESSFQNLLSQHYSEAFGYPSLPFTFRMGMKFSIGGESWPAK